MHARADDVAILNGDKIERKPERSREFAVLNKHVLDLVDLECLLWLRRAAVKSIQTAVANKDMVAAGDVNDGAVVQHDAVRQGARVPMWKYYYEARNMLYLHLHVMHRVGWYPRNVTKLVGRALLRERGRRDLAKLRRSALDAPLPPCPE